MPETTAPDPRDAAIRYVVRRIAEDPAVYWHFLGTESWTRLLQAYAAITGQPLTDLHYLMSPDEDAYREQCDTETRRARLDQGERVPCPACAARDEAALEIPETRFVEIIALQPPLLHAWDDVPAYDRPRLLKDLAYAAY